MSGFALTVKYGNGFSVKTLVGGWFSSAVFMIGNTIKLRTLVDKWWSEGGKKTNSWSYQLIVNHKIDLRPSKWSSNHLANEPPCVTVDMPPTPLIVRCWWWWRRWVGPAVAHNWYATDIIKCRLHLICMIGANRIKLIVNQNEERDQDSVSNVLWLAQLIAIFGLKLAASQMTEDPTGLTINSAQVSPRLISI